jgi:hypothetical protein
MGKGGKINYKAIAEHSLPFLYHLHSRLNEHN